MKKVLTILLSLNISVAFAQIDTTQRTIKGVSLRTYYGFIIPHSESIRAISSSNPFGMELDWHWHLIHEKALQNFGNYPRVGFTFQYTNFANPNILGNAFSFISYFEPHIAPQRLLHFSFRMGIGVSYLDKVYDSENNPENLFYSSPISFLINAGLQLHYRLHPRWHIELGGVYNHISNGGLSLPNKGINFPTVHLGATYSLNPIPFYNRPIKNWREIHPKRTTYQIFVFGTAKPLDKEKPQRYPVLGINPQIKHIVSRMSAFTGGLEWAYNGVKQEIIQNNQIQGHAHQLALIGGHELLLGKFAFTQKIGWYFLRSKQVIQEDLAFYQRYGLYFRATPKFLVGINLKSHVEVADYMDLRVGINF